MSGAGPNRVEPTGILEVGAVHLTQEGHQGNTGRVGSRGEEKGSVAYLGGEEKQAEAHHGET